jgi:hypothetical protein
MVADTGTQVSACSSLGWIGLCPGPNSPDIF